MIPKEVIQAYFESLNSDPYKKIPEQGIVSLLERFHFGERYDMPRQCGKLLDMGLIEMYADGDSISMRLTIKGHQLLWST